MGEVGIEEGFSVGGGRTIRRDCDWAGEPSGGDVGWDVEDGGLAMGEVVDLGFEVGEVVGCCCGVVCLGAGGGFDDSCGLNSKLGKHGKEGFCPTPNKSSPPHIHSRPNHPDHPESPLWVSLKVS